MDNFDFWWYIIAGVIFYWTRSRKKRKEGAPRPGTANKPPQNRPKSFEELVKEITGDRKEEESEPIKQDPIIIEGTAEPKTPVTEEKIELEGSRRAFSDDESRKIYEKSMKIAEESDSSSQPDKLSESERLFKHYSIDHKKTNSFAKELMDNFDATEAKKAVIYSEIFNRKY